jgi:hypothetical protein
LRQRQIIEKKKFGDINCHFILAGDNLLIEGRSFDFSSKASDGFKVLFLGNFTETPPPKSLMEVLKSLLHYAIDLGKLDANFKLYGERQLDTKAPSSPGDALYELLQKPPLDEHFDFNVTEPEKCWFACGGIE